MWVLFFIIPFKLSTKYFDIGIPLALSVSANLISKEYIKLIILSEKSVLQNLFWTLERYQCFLLTHHLLNKDYKVLLT